MSEVGAAGEDAVKGGLGGHSVGVVTSNSISSQSIFGGSSFVNMPYHDLEAELERANAQAAQASMDYQHVLQINESLQDELVGARAAASESSAATQRVQTESRNAIMDIASRASKQLKHQQERCNSLEVTVEKLQSQLNEYISHLGTMKMLEADLLLARQTVRKKELERDMYERKYLTLKAEFDDSTVILQLEIRTKAPPQTASSSSAEPARCPRLLLPSRGLYCLVKLKSDSKK